MKFWGKLLLIYILIILGIGVALRITHNHLKADYLADRAATQRTAYSSVLQGSRLLADTFFNEVINQPDILEQVQNIVHTEGAEQQKQRGLLYRSLAATYKRTKTDISEILHFQFPDNRSMLRFHLPSVSGDDLTEYRPSIAACNSFQHEVHGFESGRAVHGYRHIYPLTYQQEHIGSVEVSLPFQQVYRKVQQLKTAIKTEFLFFHIKDDVFDKLFSNYRQEFVPAELHPAFVRQKQSRQLVSQSEQTEPIDENILAVLADLNNNDQTQQNLTQGISFSQHAKSETTIYSVVFYPITNISGKAAGYLLGMTPEPQIQTLSTRFHTVMFLSAATLFGFFFYRGTLQTQLIEKKLTKKSLQAFFDNKLVGMVQHDTDGNYQQVNRQWETMSGYSREELLQMNYKDLTHPDDLERSSLLTQFVTSHHHQSLQLPKRYVRKDGTTFWANLSGTGLYNDKDQFIGMVGMINDISKMKEDEEQLRSSEQRLDLALKGAKCGMWDWNLSQNELHFDPNYYRIAGYQPDDFPQTFEEWKNRVHPEDMSRVETAIESYLAGETEGFSTEFRFQRKDGTWMWILGQGKIVERADDGSPVRMAGLHMDINDRMLAEIEHAELETQLRQKFKMEAVGTMAGGIAHNFNNNLSIILGNVELSQLKIQNPEVQGLLSNAKIAVQRSRDLVSQIMTYSRKGQLTKAPLQLSLLLDETIKLTRSTMPSTVQLTQTISDVCYHATINANASQIQECLLNLCNNAVQAMNEEGELNISLDLVKLQQSDLPDQDQHQPGSYVKLSIRDSGCGIAPDILEKIFDPFFTTKELFEGTGMGLSTVQGIIDQHGGLIQVNSTLGKGTTFDLYFPMIEQAQAAEPAPLKVELTGGCERILFIDDDEMLAQLGNLMLTEMGYQVTVMTDSVEALKLFTANPAQFDLIITDQTMPDLTGKELIQKVKVIRADLPTIICTGFSSKLDEDSAKELGASAFLMKPLELPTLLRTVRQALDGTQS